MELEGCTGRAESGNRSDRPMRSKMVTVSTGGRAGEAGWGGTHGDHNDICTLRERPDLMARCPEAVPLMAGAMT